MSNLSSDLMSSRPDWLRFTIVTNYGFTQTFEEKQSQSLLLSNSYGNFVFCSFENYNERQEIDRGISVGYRL